MHILPLHISPTSILHDPLACSLEDMVRNKFRHKTDILYMLLLAINLDIFSVEKYCICLHVIYVRLGVYLIMFRP